MLAATDGMECGSFSVALRLPQFLAAAALVNSALLVAFAHGTNAFRPRPGDEMLIRHDAMRKCSVTRQTATSRLSPERLEMVARRLSVAITQVFQLSRTK
jgi:hypothetical protein